MPGQRPWKIPVCSLAKAAPSGGAGSVHDGDAGARGRAGPGCPWTAEAPGSSTGVPMAGCTGVGSVSAGPEHDRIVQAWLDGADGSGCGHGGGPRRGAWAVPDVGVANTGGGFRKTPAGSRPRLLASGQMNWIGRDAAGGRPVGEVG